MVSSEWMGGWIDTQTRLGIEGAKAACEGILEEGCDPITALSLAKTLEAQAAKIRQTAAGAARRQAFEDAMRR